MSNHLIGQLSALGAALTWAMAVVLFKRSGEHLPPVPLNLFKNLVGLVLLGATLAALGGALEPFRTVSRADLAILAASGFLGIALADSLLFYGLNAVGVGRVAVVECTYSPFVIGFSALLLGERPATAHYLGGALILAGILVLGARRAPGMTGRQLGSGLAAAVAAMGLMAFGIVLAKPVLERVPLIWATTVRLAVGTVALAALWAAGPRRRELALLLRPSRFWRTSLPASVLGSYVALLLWTAGFKYTLASVAALLNQTSMIFAIVFAAFFLREPFTRQKLVAASLALLGVLLVTLASP